MFDIEVSVPRGAESLVQIADILGAAEVGLEGGGMWSGVAHYLIAEPDAATLALAEAGWGAAIVRPVVVAELHADVPGALGRMMRVLVDAGIALHAQYSDHDNRKVLVVDDVERARRALGGG
ncbi:amino acid-binding ACT domain-containing protein [Microbacterium caowuchunii]|uniref:amino acid-binding ACT domain-containing protein n=1 Tax=Microbacterium caowuchunii TaxID=2614638 RepID=UPI001246943D|nr:amino acid-binding ACT domain-containing protein [Microbacterium caowuchunii]QEW00162.1 amino acid-binding ACT domain-containing protein [Microbacterium caowuchunii]